MWATGKKIKARTKIPMDGRRNFTGLLQRYSHGTISIRLDQGTVELALKDIEKANVLYPFE